MTVHDLSDDFGARQEQHAPTRRSYWPIGLALLIAVLLLLGGATVLNQRLRPKVELQATTTAHAQETSLGFILGRLALQDELGDADPVAAPSPETGIDAIEIDLALLEEIQAAYSTFWEIRAEAAFNLDVSRLPEVLDGPALEREREQIADLQARGVAAVIEAEHEVGLLSLSSEEAELYDEYLNRSYLVDPTTKEPVGAPEPEEVVKVSFRLRKIDGIWKVVDSERHS
ncbi:MAG: hypothetical protein IT305_19385 [Chloroflexi bacterium]|nr:hypothetical protein [Chloroflexota bacterium]